MSHKNDDTGHYEGALLEDINGKLDAILEGQAAMASVPSRLASLETNMATVKFDLKTLKTAVTDEFREVRGEFREVKQRLSRLERFPSNGVSR